MIIIKKPFIDIKITESRAKDFIICSKNAKKDPNIVKAFSSKNRGNKNIQEEKEVNFMSRVIKQIVTGTDGGPGTNSSTCISHTLYALCEDNTIWKLCKFYDYDGEREWIKIPKIPEV